MEDFGCNGPCRPALWTARAGSQAQVNYDVLEDLSVALEAGGEDKVPAAGGHQGEGARRLDVHLLEALKLFLLRVPQVDLREGVVAAQRQVVALLEGEGLQDHGASRRQRLDLHKLLGAPVQQLGVPDVTRHGQVEFLLDPEVFHCHHVLHVGDLSLLDELLVAAAPLVDDRHLGAAGQDEVGLAVHVQELCVRVAEPLVQRLVRVEALVVPLVQCGQARLGAVGDHKVPVAGDLEGFNVVGLGDLGHLDVLELVESALVVVKLVNVGAAKELGHYDKHQALDDHSLAPHNGLA